MKRAVLAALAVAGLVALPMRASAQTRTAGTGGESESGVPYARIDTGRDDPYRRLDFEVAGRTMAALAPAIIRASATDAAHQRFSSGRDLGGFRTAPVGSASWAPTGMQLTGIAAPRVVEGSPLADARARRGATGATFEPAIPALGSSAGLAPGSTRNAFAFTDATGAPTAPPESLPPLANPPTPPSEGPSATPATTTTTEPAAPTGTTAPDAPAVVAIPPSPTTLPQTSTTTTAGPPVTASPSTTTPPTTAPVATTVPATTSTTRSTTSTTLPSTTSTTPTTTSTTTTVPTTTTLAPPTTTTTQPPPAETFTLTQERPAATACVAPTGGAETCDAIWSVALAATGETRSFDLTLRNTGNVDAAALQLWASAPCTTTSTATPSGTGDLCGAIQITVQRFTTAARDVPLECVYGGGTAQVCSLSSSRTLGHLSSTHPSSSQARTIGSGLASGEAAHLRLTLHLPDVDNRYQRRAASISLTWRQVQ